MHCSETHGQFFNQRRNLLIRFHRGFGVSAFHRFFGLDHQFVKFSVRLGHLFECPRYLTIRGFIRCRQLSKIALGRIFTARKFNFIENQVCNVVEQFVVTALCFLQHLSSPFRVEDICFCQFTGQIHKLVIFQLPRFDSRQKLLPHFGFLFIFGQRLVNFACLFVFFPGFIYVVILPVANVRVQMRI